MTKHRRFTNWLLWLGIGMLMGGTARAETPLASSGPATISPRPACALTFQSNPLPLVRGARAEDLNVVRPGPGTLRMRSVSDSRGAAAAPASSADQELCKALMDRSGFLLKDPENKSISLPVAISRDKNPEGEYTLHLGGIPADLPEREREWEIWSTSPPSELVARLTLDTVSMPVVESLAVTYQDSFLDGLHSGTAAVGRDNRSSVAVVNLAWRSTRSGGKSVPDQVLRAVLNTATFASVRRLPLNSGDSFSWSIESTTWGGAERVWFEGCKAGNPEKCRLSTITRISFAARERSPLPLIATLKGSSTSGNFTVNVALASESRVESLPIPIASLIEIKCGQAQRRTQAADPCGEYLLSSETRITNSSTRAVDDDELRGGLCRAYIDYNAMAPAKPKQTQTQMQTQSEAPTEDTNQVGPARQRAILWGPQTVEIRVHREGAGEDAVTRWTLRPEEKIDLSVPPTTKPLRSYDGPNAQGRLNKWTEDKGRCNVDFMALPVPANDQQGDGPYRVDIRVDALTPEATYRDATGSGQSKTQLIAGLPDRQFRAVLRPRGPFGFRKRQIRMFATIPVQISGLRLPAIPRNLRASTDNPYAELTSIRSGVLVALEPWDYDAGRNRWALPLRFLAGFNLLSVDVRGASFEPTATLGVAATFPLLQSDKKIASQIGTSLALGLMGELDLRDAHPYLLVSLGFNVLSLLAPH